DYRREDGPSLLDVGVTPGLFVETVPEMEDSAYLALDAGQPVSELLDAPVQKARFDEARLQQYFDETRSGNGGAPTLPSADSSAADDAAESSDGDLDDEENDEAEEDVEAAGVDADTPAFDRSLQRAVSTLVAHRALHGSQPVS